jgi:hypothetical protein
LSQRARLRSQDGFIREAIWIVVILTVIAVVILDGMAIFNAYQSAGDSANNAADEARTNYALTTNVAAARLAADEYLAKKGLEMKGFKAVQTTDGAVQFTVTAGATADTYAFHYLASIPPLKDWVERTIHPTRVGNAQ